MAKYKSDIPRNQRPATPCPKCRGPRDRLPSGWMRCTPCDTKRSKNYHSRNRDKHKERVKKYYYENPETYAKYVELNKEAILEKNRKHWWDNRDRLLEYHRDRYWLTKEESNERSRQYYKDHLEEAKAYRKRYVAEIMHPDLPVYKSMIKRCYDPKDQNFWRYGERGIRVCDRWLGADGFDNFIADMGSRPEPRHLYSIDRMNNNGNYEPDNCCWATSSQQNRNRRNTLWVEHEGKFISLSDFAELKNISYVKAKYQYYEEIDRNRKIFCYGQYLPIKEISDKTGIDENILLRRAKRSNHIEYLTASIRETPTFLFRENYYTIHEISILTKFDYWLLYDRVILQKMSIDQALTSPIKV